MTETLREALPFFSWANGKLRVDLDLVFPPLRESIARVLMRCKARGHHFYVTSGYRSVEEQRALHDAYRAGKGGRAARPGYSAHNYGLAFDFAADANEDKRGLQLDASSWTQEAFDVLVEEAEKEPLLAPGRRFGDTPHIGIAAFVSREELEPLRQLMNDAGDTLEGLAMVWDVVAERHADEIDRLYEVGAYAPREEEPLDEGEDPEEESAPEQEA